MTKPIQLAVLIDDEKIDQRQYQRIMNKSGLVEEVLGFTYADEALEHLKANPQLEVDVILLDINMPRMDGFQFLEAASREIGEGFAKSVVVMITTSLNPEDKARAMRFDVVKDFLNKPLTVEHVKQIAALIASH
ncbi:response regulator [Leisingera sp. S132]|uniref:response regulator n=1 Tax=Leisingera sp. S132 TaxID=2867016 RepID=UPI0021A2B19E|nr:response regulator [Leisingera sp. S132]UWQ78121.1 response regulator [Leisingera sp. S132]